jgi:hypothetical protein
VQWALNQWDARQEGVQARAGRRTPQGAGLPSAGALDQGASGKGEAAGVVEGQGSWDGVQQICWLGMKRGQPQAQVLKTGAGRCGHIRLCYRIAWAVAPWK